MMNAQVQYALGIENPTDKNCCISPKSFWDWKEKIRSKELHDNAFGKFTFGPCQITCNVNMCHVRIDSVKKTNMKIL
jgi:hypothetical protein